MTWQNHIELNVLKRGRVGQSYNIGGNSELTNIEIVRGICDLVDELHPSGSGRSARQLIRFVADRPGHDHRYAIDFSKLETELGWRPKTRFSDGLRATVRWYLDHQEWIRRVQSGAYRRQRLGLSTENGILVKD